MPSKINTLITKITGELTTKDKEIGNNLANINERINNIDKIIKNLDNIINNKIKNKEKLDIDALQSNIKNKLPLIGGHLIGNVTTNNTIDGRNISTDGSKLDLIDDEHQKLSIRIAFGG